MARYADATTLSARLRIAVVAAALAGTLVGQAVPAVAHYIYTSGVWTYRTSSTCQQQRTEISHGTGYGYSKTVGISHKRGLSPWGFEDCFNNNPVGAGNLRALNQLYVKSSSGSWLLCTGRGYSYNSSTTHIVEQAYTWPQILSTGQCGTPKEYRTMGHSAHYDGTAWRGGSATSGAVGHTLVTTSG